VESLGIFPNLPTEPCAPGSTQPLKMSYRILLGVKTAPVRKGEDLTTFIVSKVEKIRSLNLSDPQGFVQACSGKTLPLHFKMTWTVVHSPLCLT
jgi:hypothetical protein